MKKIVYISMLGIFSLLLFSCFGGPERDYSTTEATISLISGHHSEVELLKVGNAQQIELIGLWKAKNVHTNTYSQIFFNENGYFQEEIYSNLTGEKMASIEGQYATQNDRLEISIDKGDVYRFEYLLNGAQLNLKSLTR